MNKIIIATLAYIISTPYAHAISTPYAHAQELSTRLNILATSLNQLHNELESAADTPTLQKIDTTTYTLNHTQIKLITGDITKQKGIEVMVNAANKEGISSGFNGGIAAAIEKALGDTAREAFNADITTKYSLVKNDEQNLGKAFAGKISPGIQLSKNGYKFLINAVGPNCGAGDDVNKLADAYQNSLVEAEKLGATSIVFPRISSAIFGCDPKIIDPMAVNTILNYITTNPTTALRTIYFIFFNKSADDKIALAVYKKLLDAQAAKST